MQVTLKRDLDGSVTNDSITVIPCCVSQARDSNDYRPTPYEEGSAEYERAMSKLNGTYEGGDISVDYSSWYQRG